MSRTQLSLLGVGAVAIILAAVAYLFLFNAPSDGTPSPHGAKPGFTLYPDDRAIGVNTGKVYYVLRVYPINGAADGAAEGLARCAGTGDTYFHFIDVLFRNQKDWDPEYNPPDVHAGLVKIAALAAGMDETKANACMADKANAERINKVAKEGTERYSINATPTLVINGVAQQPGDMPWPTLKATLDSFLSKK